MKTRKLKQRNFFFFVCFVCHLERSRTCRKSSFILSFCSQSTDEAMAIVQRFPFSSALQRMSVVTVTHGGRSALAFIKGSPEMVASLCQTQTGSKLTQIITIALVTFTHVLFFCSTFSYFMTFVHNGMFAFPVPAQFSSKLHSFSSEGLRVLAVAYKPLNVNSNLSTIER